MQFSVTSVEMRDQSELRIAKWAFFLGDLVLIGVAGSVYVKSTLPIGLGQAVLIVFCAVVGACLAIVPFILEYRAAAKLAESASLVDVVGQIKNLQTVGEQIAGATGRWQSVQEVAERVASTSRAIAERMSAEAKAFTEFMQRANETEKATLRLEAEKLRRSEAEWVHVVVRMLDHVYALHVAAVRSGQPKLVTQMDHFQHACRDAARRIGLTPFVPDPSELFDPQRHQVLEGEPAPAQGATVTETVATGYTFQGRLLRPALVRVQQTNGNGGNAPDVPSEMPASAKPPIAAEAI